MGTHLVAYSSSIDSATPTQLDTLVDDVLTRTGTTRYLVPDDYRYIMWSAALGVSLTRAYLSSPSLQVRRTYAEIIPHRRGANAFSLDGLQVHVPIAPIELTATEELEALAAEDATGAEREYVLVALGPGERPAIPTGDIRIVRATATTTLTANAWTTVTVTPELSLEPGEYSLIGFLPISAGCIAARALFTGAVYRPGVPGLAGSEAAARSFDPATLPGVQWYEMGSFTHLTIPQFQFLSASADTSETVIMWVVKTG